VRERVEHRLLRAVLGLHKSFSSRLDLRDNAKKILLGLDPRKSGARQRLRAASSKEKVSELTEAEAENIENKQTRNDKDLRWEEEDQNERQGKGILEKSFPKMTSFWSIKKLYYLIYIHTHIPLSSRKWLDSKKGGPTRLGN
jgi:hypothetical protein